MTGHELLVQLRRTRDVRPVLYLRAACSCGWVGRRLAARTPEGLRALDVELNVHRRRAAA